MGVTFAIFQSVGTMLLSNDRLNSSASDAQIYGSEIFKILFEILSNPTVFP